MGKPTGFLEIERRERGYEPVAERLKTWKEFVHPLPGPEIRAQASRCMSCGIPFCHQGCPVNNNFPEFTGRICPAPCEASCTLNIPDSPVTIKSIECQIVDRGWEEGWIIPE